MEESMNINVGTGSDLVGTMASLGENATVKKVGLTFYPHMFDSQEHATMRRRAGINQPSQNSRKRSRSGDIIATTSHAQAASDGSLPNLEELSCSGGMAMHSLQVSKLTALLRQSTGTNSNLRMLSLFRIQLLGHAQDFDDLAECLLNLPKLVVFNLEDCKIAADATPQRRRRRHNGDGPTAQTTTATSTPPAFSINTLLKALAQLPSMETIQVSTKELCGMGILSPATLETLCWSPTLKRLVLKGFILNAQHVYSMGPGLASSLCLQTVILHKLGATTGLQATKVNDCLTYMLQENRSLQHFELPAMTGNHAPRWVQIASKVLHKNTQLRVLHLGGGNTSQQRHTNSNNHTGGNDEEASVRFHLKLNQAGRSRLLGPHNSNNNNNGVALCNREWINVIGNVSDDLDCVFYFLSRNPSLCGRL